MDMRIITAAVAGSFAAFSFAVPVSADSLSEQREAGMIILAEEIEMKGEEKMIENDDFDGGEDDRYDLTDGEPPIDDAFSDEPGDDMMGDGGMASEGEAMD
ncbi:hypothetical protein V6C03_05920 [Methyloligella sp. 2.7D]|uniref:hypothetical protein n=1 Tax=unclassified Methyloligella TaxID=2625955 RepID=UPI00157E25C6|nr:hypothetical protein [Methyloligella sp. GL2]QKP78545.1 hypothetical protein HT051_14530 [Methyloligella sp. GL2]